MQKSISVNCKGEIMNYWLMFYDDWASILLIFIGFILVIGAQIKINSAYSKYRKISNSTGLTGGEVARRILDANGLTNIPIFETRRKSNRPL